jgi:ABC-2 type transport system permease protein
MKFLEIFRFEFAYQIRRPWPWLIIVMLMLLVFLFMRDGSFAEALYTEFFINSPFMVAMATVFGSLLWLLTAAFITGEAAARDVSTGMHPLTYTVPITKAEYLGGRFLAAFALNVFILLTVQLTIFLAVYLPGVHPGSVGLFRPAAFLAAYFFIALPNAFAATAIQFMLASWTGRPIAAYLGSLLLFFTAFFIASLILFRSGLGTLLDPIGVRFIWDELSHLWTTVEKSYRLLELKGTLLQNRLVWMATGLSVSAITYITFGFTHRANEFTWWRRFIRRQTSTLKLQDPAPSILNQESRIQTQASGTQNFGLTFHTRQMLSIAWSSFRTLATSWAGLAMLIFIPLLAIPVVIDQMVAMSVPLVPTTARVIKELTGPISADMSRWMIIPGFIIFFAGELVWRERDNDVNEITDTMPGSEWAPMLGKFLGLSLMLVVFMVALTMAGMVAQLLMDYTNFQIGLYFKMMFGLQLPEYLLFVVLAFFVHVVANQKYTGHLVAIVVYAFIAAIATMLGIEHNLWIYGAGPGWSYTEMREFGASIGPWLWFKLYWAAWALLLVVVTRLFWVRGKESGIDVRLKLARRRFSNKTVWTAGVAVSLILSLGGFIFYNTNILNKYRNSTEVGDWRAEYERRYGRYENISQPQLTATKLHIEIYPERRAVEIRGSYFLLNASDVTIDSIHVSTSTGGATTKALTFDQKTTLALDDAELAYRIYVLETPLNPGDTLELGFEVDAAPRGFRNGGIDPSLDASGSYFTNQGWFPSIGFQRQRGLTNPAERRMHGLAPRPLMASLYQAHEGNPPSLDAGIAFEAIVGTSEDQVAVAPGTLHRTWSEKGRRYFHYSSSEPIGSDWAFFSANYHVHEQEWVQSPSSDSSEEVSGADPVVVPHADTVVVRIFHHPKHHAHREHMMRGVLASLEYYSKQFGPYPYNHLTLIEHPYAPGTGMHAEPSLIYYGQGYPYWLPKNENQLDFPYAVMGHEMAHQWTLPLALVEGLPFMSEGLAWYYGIMLVKETRGPEQTRKLLSFLRQPYPHQPIRRGEPLLRGLDPYLSYRRGPFALYALTEYIGTDQVNGAIRQLVSKSDSVGAPLVTTLDLYRELQAVTPDSMQYLLHDLFEVNTLWQLETKRVTAGETKAGMWQVTIDVHARKIVYDSAGVETEMPMDELISIGVFAMHVPGRDELSTPLYLKKHRIRSGDQTIIVTVSGKPILAGIDPNHLLDWEEKEEDDNIEAVNPVSGR